MEKHMQGQNEAISFPQMLEGIVPKFPSTHESSQALRKKNLNEKSEHSGWSLRDDGSDILASCYPRIKLN